MGLQQAASVETSSSRSLRRAVFWPAARKNDVKVTGRATLSMLNWMVRCYQPGKGRRATSLAKDYCELILGGIGK